MSNEQKKARDALREAVEKTVPAEDFSPEAIREMAEKTVVDLSPEETAGRYLRRTASDWRDGTAASETITRFGETSEVPAQLSDKADAEGPRFSIVEKIGSGATSQVYAVHDNSLSRTIAVKFLKQSRNSSGKAEERFLHEARVTAQLEHPNIMPIHDIGLDNKSRLFFTMKNVHGRSIGEAIRAVRHGETIDGFRGVQDILEIFYKVCDAVGFAHDHGYIHQDIKPDNIMLGGHGEVLLLDWGCALDRNAVPAEAGKAIYGTPAYMSPEQARRELADERSDIYCLGATLYHMLTLHHPTWADDPEAFWAMKCAGELSPLPDDAVGRVPAALLDICRKSMAPDPAGRYQDVGAFRGAVREYQVHAEAIALTTDAAQRLGQATEKGEYALFSEVTHDLRQALRMWPEYVDALETALKTRRAHASCALERNDLQLADSIVGEDPALADIRTRIDERRAAQNRRRRGTQVVQAAAALLGVAVLGLLAYLAVDYFRYFGTWRTVYHWNPSLGTPRDLSRSVDEQAPLTTSPDSVAFNGMSLVVPRSMIVWFDSIQVPYDVRFEAVVMWPEQVDGFEIHIQARREAPPQWWMCPAGFTCQFGGLNGFENWISRQDVGKAPTTSCAVAADFDTGRWYRLAFELRENNLAMFVDGRKVLEQTQLLPLPGRGFEHLAFRCWHDTHVRSLTVRRMALPRKASPLVVGDAAVVRGDFEDAVRQYLRLADDFPEDRLAQPALAKAYLAASLLEHDRECVKEQVRARLSKRFPESPFWAVIKKVECIAAWKERDFERALALLGDVFAQEPDTRLALELLALRDGNMLPADVRDALMSWIGRTTRVGRLDLSEFGLTSCEVLRGVKPNYLDLSANDIASLEPLAGMPLEVLDISQNRVRDLGPLEGMPLEQLTAGGNLVADLSPLGDAPLKELYISHNKIADLAPLRDAPVEQLDISNNAVETLEPLRGAPLLRLNANNNQFSSLEPLEGMSLIELHVQGCGATDLTPLSGMPLEELNLDDTRASDLSPIASCSSLVHLSISGCPIQDLSALRGTGIEKIEMNAVPVSDFSPLRDLPLNDITAESLSISPLETLQGLAPRILKLQHGPVTNLALLDTRRLRELRAAGTGVSDLTPLAGASLSVLDISATPVRSLSALRRPVPLSLDFSCDDFDAAHLEQCIARWRAWGDTAAARRLETRFAVAQGDYERAKRGIQIYAGHQYLLVAGELTYAQADSICAALGAHLLTVTTAGEYWFTRRLQRLYSESNVWLALPFDARPAAWLTGEPVTFYNFRGTVSPDVPVRWYQLESNAVGWYYDMDGSVRAGFIAEWSPD